MTHSPDEYFRLSGGVKKQFVADTTDTTEASGAQAIEFPERAIAIDTMIVLLSRPDPG